MEYEISVKTNQNTSAVLGYANVLFKENGEELFLVKHVKLLKYPNGKFRVIMPHTGTEDRQIPAIRIKNDTMKQELAKALYTAYMQEKMSHKSNTTVI